MEQLFRGHCFGVWRTDALRRFGPAVFAMALTGCAAQAQPTTPQIEPAAQEVVAKERATRLKEAEKARLAKLESAKRSEEASRKALLHARKTVRIVTPAIPAPEDEGWDVPSSNRIAGPTARTPKRAKQGRIRGPVLRLYGKKPTAPDSDPMAGMQHWSQQYGTLPVAPGMTRSNTPPIPTTPYGSYGQQAPMTAIAPSPYTFTRPQPIPQKKKDGTVSEYRAALRLVRDRKFDEALTALSRFVQAHPSHAYTANARYWTGEVHYAQRRYPEALRALTYVVDRFPKSRKAPDALLKIGMCHMRMGQLDEAKSFFRKVKKKYPKSVAARLAAREDAS